MTATYYRELPVPDDSYESSRIRSRAGHVVQVCRALKIDAKRLIDIGCGKGILLNEARLQGLETTGIELSRESCEFARKHYALTVLQSNFPSFKTKRLYNQADVVVLSHVLEHILYPAVFLREAAKCLSRKGLLIIETPNVDSWLNMFEKNNFTFLTPPEHVCLYSIKSILVLLNVVDVNVRIVKKETFTEPEHGMGIIKRMLHSDNPTSNSASGSPQHPAIKNLKTGLFDKWLIKFLVPFFNIGNKGSILRVYIQKKS